MLKFVRRENFQKRRDLLMTNCMWLMYTSRAYSYISNKDTSKTGKRCGRKTAKQRISILLFANVVGDKLVIGESKILDILKEYISTSYLLSGVSTKKREWQQTDVIQNSCIVPE